MDTVETVVEQVECDPVISLIESGAGRRKLAVGLGITEHQARQLLATRTNGVVRGASSTVVPCRRRSTRETLVEWVFANHPFGRVTLVPIWATI